MPSQTYLHKYLKRPLPEENKVQNKISSFLKLRQRRNIIIVRMLYTLKVTILILLFIFFFLVNEIHTSFARPLTS